MKAEDKLNQIAEIIGGRPWGVDKLKPRVYMNGHRKDIKVFFEFPDAAYDPRNPADDDYLGGDKLSIFIDDCGQHPNWYRGQREKIAKQYYPHMLAVAAIGCDEVDFAKTIMDDDEIEINAALLDEMSGHLINGRAAKAKAAWNAAH